MIKVVLPSQFNSQEIEVSNISNIKQLLNILDKRLDSKFVNIFLNDNDIRFMSNKDTELKDGDIVTFIPAIAGGLC